MASSRDKKIFGSRKSKSKLTGRSKKYQPFLPDKRYYHEKGYIIIAKESGGGP